MRWLVRTSAAVSMENSSVQYPLQKTRCVIDQVIPTLEQQVTTALRQALHKWDGTELRLTVTVDLLEMMFQPSLPGVSSIPK